MPHLESKTKLIMTASVNKYINPYFNENLGSTVAQFETNHLAIGQSLAQSLHVDELDVLRTTMNKSSAGRNARADCTPSER